LAIRSVPGKHLSRNGRAHSYIRSHRDAPERRPQVAKRI
jgi:hypothetical protein